MQRNRRSMVETEVIAPNLKRKYSGVTSTVAALLPIQARDLRIATVGPRLPLDWPQLGVIDLLRHARSPIAGRPFRIWHARRNGEMLAGVILKWWCGKRLKLVFTSAAQREHTRWTRFLIRRMDAVIAVSPESASYLKVPCTVISHGVDTTKFHPSPDRAQEWKEGGLPGRYGIGIFGRVRAQKGTDRFVDAMCVLLPRYPECTAVIVGSIKPEEIAFVADLKSRAAAAGVASRIVFLGELPMEEVRAWLRRVIVNVSPQRWEGFGLLPLEAGASATTSVATRVGAAPRLIIDETTGYLIDKDDMTSLEARLDKLMASPQATIAMGIAAHQHVLAGFSIEREASAIRAVYDRVWQQSLCSPPQPPCPTPSNASAY
ncbi:MAG: glycosyltransferase family 4 protein [Planctomycetota bacterium]|nr:glycosyltransferase family 4 protein [Planctomycetota bacterium]